MTTSATVVVIAKEPLPGKSKTRLTPPFTPEQAAALAEAALADTLATVGAVDGVRRVVALDGRAGSWLPDGFELIGQRGGGLAERLAGAFEDAGPMTLVVGMDTPQLSRGLIEEALATLAAPEIDAVLGPAADGGYWAIGLRRPDPAVFADVPMSSDRTAARQRRRFRELGLRHAELGPLRDVDTAADAVAVAGLAAGSRFADVLRTVVPA